MRTPFVTITLATLLVSPALAQQGHGEAEHKERAEHADQMAMHGQVIVLDSVAHQLGLDAATKHSLAPHVAGINETFMHLTHLRDSEKEHVSDTDKEKYHTALQEVHETMEKHHAALTGVLTKEQLERFTAYAHERMEKMGHGEMPGHDDDGKMEHKKKPGGRRN